MLDYYYNLAKIDYRYCINVYSIYKLRLQTLKPKTFTILPKILRLTKFVKQTSYCKTFIKLGI